MQDENTTQTADSASDTGTDDTTLNLGSNPSAQGDSAADKPADSDAVIPSDISSETPLEAGDKPADISTVSVASSDDLESIKSSVLEELMPIVSELDQGPEDKYRTLMMLIQSSDNQSLVKDAYEAAHAIEDKKAKAEALLNIVNEINYFTGKANGNSEGEA